MPRALPVEVRQAIVDRQAAGDALPCIARDLGRSPWTTRTVWRRSRDRGAAGLLPDDAACGRPGPRSPAMRHEAALALRRDHPG